MDSADQKLEPVRQPGNAVIDRLSFTIQRQSAMCVEFVQYAVEAEREQCAKIAEAEAQAWLSPADEPARLAAGRIAEKIRARAGAVPLVAGVAVRAGCKSELTPICVRVHRVVSWDGIFGMRVVRQVP